MNDTPSNDAAPQINGNAEPQKIPQADAILGNFIWPVMCVTVNGLRLSLPQIPIEKLLLTACSLFGRVVGETCSMGNLGDVLQYRAACIKAFSEGVRAVKPKLPPVGATLPIRPQH